MEKENPLIEFVKALARRQARIDAMAMHPTNDDSKPPVKDVRTK